MWAFSSKPYVMEFIFFQKDVLQKRSDFTCAHVLATWLSKALGLTKIIHTKREILTMMANHLVEKTEEFYWSLVYNNW